MAGDSGWASQAGGASAPFARGSVGVGHGACRALATVSVLAVCMATHHGPAAAANLEVFARTFDTRGPQVVCNDFFCTSTTVIPAADVVDSRSAERIDQLPTWEPARRSDWQRLSAATEIGQAAASAQLAHQNIFEGTTLNGVAAEATMNSVFQSQARAHLRVEYQVKVEIIGSALDQALFGALCQGGCPLGVDFLHQTSGSFLHSSAVPGARARFAESLQIENTQVAGEASITASTQNPGEMVRGAGGAWSTSDFLPSVTTPRPGGWGAGDTLTRTGFNHFEPILGATAQFFSGGIFLSGTFNLVIDQSVEADFGAAGAYTVGPTTVGADFSHTSTFSIQRAFDPSGQLDLSGLAMSVQYIDVTPVPEPGTWALWLAGLAALAGRAWRRRPRRAARCRACPAMVTTAALLLAATAPARATVLDYPVSFGNFYGDQPGVLDVHHRVTHLGANIDGLQWWPGGYDDLTGVAWAPYNTVGTLAHVDLRVLDGAPLRLDGFRLGSWAGAEGRLETVTVTAIGSSTPAWQFSGLIGVGNLANSFDIGLQSTTGFTITWTNPWWTAIDDIRFQASAVPEPSAGWLLLAGLAGLAPLARRRRG